MQGDAFSRAIREDTPVPVPLEDSLNNMAVIEAVLRAGESRPVGGCARLIRECRGPGGAAAITLREKTPARCQCYPFTH